MTGFYRVLVIHNHISVRQSTTSSTVRVQISMDRKKRNSNI